MRGKHLPGNLVLGLLGAAFALFILLPLVMVVFEAFGNRWFGAEWLPPVWTLKWFGWAVATVNIPQVLVNTVVIALLATVISLALAFPAAYAIARYDLPVKGLLLSLILFPRMIPEITFALGVAKVMYALHLQNTYLGIALAHVLLAAPFAVLVLSASLQGLDERLLEAARVLGCAPGSVFTRVILPLSAPGLMSAALFSFLASYNDFVLTLMLYGPNTVTLPVQTYISIGNGYLPVASAISMILLVPSVLFLLVIAGRLRPETLLGGLKGA